MVGYPGGHTTMLVAAIATHALVGAALGVAVAGRARAGLVGGVAADVDLLVPPELGFPLAHRGLTHAPLVAVAAVAAVAVYDRYDAAGFGAGYASQLAIDLGTDQGIPLAYPFSSAFVSLDVGSHGVVATALLWAASLLLLWFVRHGERSVGGPPAE